MSNPDLFSSKSATSSFGLKHPKTDTVNNAGGVAYKFTPMHALAQMVATGVFRNTYYTSGAEQLKAFMEITEDKKSISDERLAKLAIWGRHNAYMKDTPAACVMRLLSRNNMDLFHKVFDKVIDNGRMLRNAFQMLRSGVFGRRSMGYSVQRAFQRWFNEKPVHVLVAGSVGNNPSLKDVLRAARPTPKDQERDALFGWLAGKATDAQAQNFPQMLKDILEFRANKEPSAQIEVLNRMGGLRWEMLSDAIAGPEVWKVIIGHMGHQALRMNLNTLDRHDVFKSKETVNYVASRLSDVEEIKKARQWPIQYFSAYMNADNVPHKIREALCSAAEVACGNIPELDGPLVIGVDTSGSMGSPITGVHAKGGASSKVTCRDAAALFAAALIRKNPDSLVVPFDDRIHKIKIDPGDTILSISKSLSRLGGGGTCCHLPLQHANSLNRPFAGCVMISDNESWIGTGRYGSTGVMSEWNIFVDRQKKLGVYPAPKLLNIDIAPYASTQAVDRVDILNVGGFSDSVFSVISGWMFNKAGTFVDQIEAVQL